jgi:hypothetical protein
MKAKKSVPQVKDSHLDVPAEANRDKHINFLASEEQANTPSIFIDMQHENDQKRKKQWRQGIEEGRSKSKK